MPVQADNHKRGIRRVEIITRHRHWKKPMALFMSISEGVPEIKLAKVKMKMEFQRESEGVLL